MARLHWIGPKGNNDPRWELLLRPEDWELYAVIVVSLLTCGCREGRGHRFLGNPTGASLGISMWGKGRECLLERMPPLVD